MRRALRGQERCRPRNRFIQVPARRATVNSCQDGSRVLPARPFHCIAGQDRPDPAGEHLVDHCQGGLPARVLGGLRAMRRAKAERAGQALESLNRAVIIVKEPEKIPLVIRRFPAYRASLLAQIRQQSGYLEIPRPALDRLGFFRVLGREAHEKKLLLKKILRGVISPQAAVKGELHHLEM
jgi:hypothetical protein